MNNYKDTKHYCPIPFYSVEINTNETIKLCCVSSRRYNINGDFLKFWNSDEMEGIRGRMLRDEPDKQDCGLCYAREENFGFSKRQDEIKDGNTFNKKTIFPTHLQLKVSNICNLKCIMCSPQYSTKWNEDVDKLILLRNTLAKTKAEQLDYDYLKKLLTMFVQTKTLNSKKIELYGGEPMIAKNFWKIIYKMDPIKLKNVSFITNTNGTILTKEHLQCLIRFKRCMINFSIDGINDNFEFVRFPAKWDVVEKNIKKLYSYRTRFPYKFDISLYFTLSSFSAIGLSDFVDYCHENKYNYYINLADTEPTPTEYYKKKYEDLKEMYTIEQINELGLAFDPTSNPVGFSHPSVLPNSIKEKLINQLQTKLNEDDFIKVKNSLNIQHEELRKLQKKFLVYCDLVKEVRGVDFKKLMEIYENS